MSIRRLRPSSARWKLTPNDGIHTALKLVIHVEVEAMSTGAEIHMTAESTRLISKQARDIHRQSARDHDAAIQARTPPAMRMMMNQSNIMFWALGIRY
jgi:hypothetical protein